jgi:hypothetical protein
MFHVKHLLRNRPESRDDLGARPLATLGPARPDVSRETSAVHSRTTSRRPNALPDGRGAPAMTPRRGNPACRVAPLAASATDRPQPRPRPWRAPRTRPVIATVFHVKHSANRFRVSVRRIPRCSRSPGGHQGQPARRSTVLFHVKHIPGSSRARTLTAATKNSPRPRDTGTRVTAEKCFT